MINDTGYKLVNTMRRYNGKLSAIGKIFCFEKMFNDLLIIEDDIKAVIPVDKPMESVSFILGYKRAKEMVDCGFNERQYQDFLENLNSKVKPSMEKILDIAYSRNNVNIKRTK